jgi:hypothetical protein
MSLNLGINYQPTNIVSLVKNEEWFKIGVDRQIIISKIVQFGFSDERFVFSVGGASSDSMPDL